MSSVYALPTSEYLHFAGKENVIIIEYAMDRPGHRQNMRLLGIGITQSTQINPKQLVLVNNFIIIFKNQAAFMYCFIKSHFVYFMSLRLLDSYI